MTVNAPTNSLADDALLVRVAGGDVPAFEVFYDRHRSRAYGLALRITGRQPLAEEVVQDAFLSVWRNAGSFNPERAPATVWLNTLVRNRGIDAIRSASRHARVGELSEAIASRLRAGDNTEDTVAARESLEVARGLVGELPAEQREAIELSYFAGLTQVEVAERVGAPLGTIKGRVRLGLSRLRYAWMMDAQRAS